MPTTHDLVETLSRQSGVPLALDADGWCMFAVDDVWIALRGTLTHLTLHGMIGTYPTRTDDADFWRDALFRNAAILKKACAAISLNDGQTLILNRPIPCDLMDIEAIGDISVTFIDTVRELSNSLPSDDGAAPPPYPDAGGIPPMFGGPFLAV
jgi:hypothetical protein